VGEFVLTAGFFNLNGIELLVIGLIVLVLFGSRLPKAARGFGQSIKEFKKGIKEGSKDDSSASDEDATPRQIESRPVAPVERPSHEQQSHRD
jgi:sec-independent protein translocase protein TatA